MTQQSNPFHVSTSTFICTGCICSVDVMFVMFWESRSTSRVEEAHVVLVQWDRHASCRRCSHAGRSYNWTVQAPEPMNSTVEKLWINPRMRLWGLTVRYKHRLWAKRSRVQYTYIFFQALLYYYPSLLSLLSRPISLPFETNTNNGFQAQQLFIYQHMWAII